jgi:hypothetical protein
MRPHAITLKGKSKRLFEGPSLTHQQLMMSLSVFGLFFAAAFSQLPALEYDALMDAYTSMGNFSANYIFWNNRAVRLRSEPSRMPSIQSI